MIRAVIRITIICLCVTVSPAHSALWPWADGMRAMCKNGASNCSSGIDYYWAGVIMVDAPDNRPPLTPSTDVRLYGIHCSQGSRSGEFRDCNFSYPASTYGHAPALTGPCSTVTGTGWELTAQSTCSIKTGWFNSGHSGSSLGAECAIFAKGPTGVITGAVSTPWGAVTPEQVANSYSTYCSKAPMPLQECRIFMPDDGVIDHGTMPPSGTDTRQIIADVACGDDVIISVMGGGVVDLGGGVTSQVSASSVVGGLAKIVSVLTLTNAEPGPRSGVLVVTVSPR